MSDVVGLLRERALHAVADACTPGGCGAATCGRTSLDTIAPGCRVRVVDIHERGSAMARRLSDLGFAPGTEVEVLRKAPLRDPVTYRVRGCEISLRSTAAALLHVEPLRA